MGSTISDRTEGLLSRVRVLNGAVRALGLVLALGATACGDDEDTAAASSAGRHPDPTGAIARCRDAIRANGPDVPPQERAAAMGHACAELYVEPACRDALRTFNDVPAHERASRFARTCARAYCPQLPEPRPALCTRDLDSVRASELGPLWSELGQAILRYDLGTEHVAAAREALGSSVTVAPPRAAEAAARPALSVIVRSDASGGFRVTIEQPDGTSAEHAIAALDRESVAALLPALPEGTSEGRAVVAGDRELPYAAMVTVMDALRSAGYTEVALSAEGEER